MSQGNGFSDGTENTTSSSFGSDGCAQSASAPPPETLPTLGSSRLRTYVLLPSLRRMSTHLSLLFSSVCCQGIGVVELIFICQKLLPCTAVRDSRPARRQNDALPTARSAPRDLPALIIWSFCTPSKRAVPPSANQYRYYILLCWCRNHLTATAA